MPTAPAKPTATTIASARMSVAHPAIEAMLYAPTSPSPSPPADERQGDGLRQELAMDVAPACADRQADADLPRALQSRTRA